MEYCVIGDRDSILGWQLAGAEGMPVHDLASARTAFRQAVEPGHCTVLVILGSAADLIDLDIEAHRLTGNPPYMTVVPGLLPDSGKRKKLEDMVQQAVGVVSGKD